MEPIYLRPMGQEDTERIVRWRNRDFVRRNFIYQELFTEEGHLRWFHTQVQTGHVVQFIICLAQSDRPVGSVYFRDIDRETGTAEYGIFIGEEDAVGRGYGTAAARQALAYAFRQMELNRVFLRYMEDNIGARISYERAGFKMTDRIETVDALQGRRTVRFMEIGREEWERRQAEDRSGISGGEHE